MTSVSESIPENGVSNPQLPIPGDEESAGPSSKTGRFAFVNISNPSELSTPARRRRIRQHARLGTQIPSIPRHSNPVLIASKPSKNELLPSLRPPVKRAVEKSPFVNISHPSQITAPQLVKFVRQHAQRKYKKDRPREDPAVYPAVKAEEGGSERENIQKLRQVVAGHEDIASHWRREASPMPRIGTSSAIYPIRMDSEAYETVAYIHVAFATSVNRNLLPIWFKLFIRDSAALMELIGVTIHYRGLLFGVPNEKKVLTYRTLALQSVHERIGDTKERYSIELAVAIARFMILDSAMGDVERYKLHRSGLVRLANLRGEVETLDEAEGLRVLLLWDDVANGYAYNIPPGFGVPHKHIQPFPTVPLTPGSPILLSSIARLKIFSPGPEVPEEEDSISNLIWDLYIFNTSIKHKLTTDSIDLFNLGMQGNALIVRFMSPDVEFSIWKPGYSIEKIVRLAALVYLSELRLFFKFSGEMYYFRGDRFVGALRDVVLDYPASGREQEWEALMELRLWVLVVGGMFCQDEGHRKRFIEATRVVMVKMGLVSWKEVLDMIENVIWIDEVFGTLAATFGKALMTS